METLHLKLGHQTLNSSLTLDMVRPVKVKLSVASVELKFFSESCHSVGKHILSLNVNQPSLSHFFIIYIV